MKILKNKFIILLILIIANQVHAEGSGELFMPGAMGRIIGNISLKDGRWVQYVINSERGLETVRLAVVGKQRCITSDRIGRWVEISGESNSLPYIMKILICGSVFSKDSVNRIILKVGTMAPIAVPIKKAKRIQIKRDKIKIISRKTERVKVPAGIFDTVKTTIQTSAGKYDIWTSREIPIYSLVKMKGKDIEIRLISYGKGAKPQLIENGGTMALDTFLNKVLGNDKEVKKDDKSKVK